MIATEPVRAITLALVPDQRERQRDREQRYADAELLACGLGAVDSRCTARQRDPDRGHRYQRDLHERHQRFGLAVAEPVVVVGRRGRDPDAEQA